MGALRTHDIVAFESVAGGTQVPWTDEMELGDILGLEPSMDRMVHRGYEAELGGLKAILNAACQGNLTLPGVGRLRQSSSDHHHLCQGRGPSSRGDHPFDPWADGGAWLMLARTEPACLVIADIAGYSGYLADVELDHAQDILADLIDTVVGALRPSFKLAKLEGDAAFVWVPAATVDGPGLQDVIERCYHAFQRRIRDIRQASTCECNACGRIPGLGLKFVAHHGLVARQRMAGREELVGTDVVVVHRLLKNRIAEDLGLPAYALYTDALTGAMGLADPTTAGMRPYRETFESVGEVEGWVADLGAAWQAEQRRQRTKVTDDDALAVITIPAAVPREILWEWTTSPARRTRWSSQPLEVVEDLANGRRGVGTVNHCAHGKTLAIEEILDWVPPEYVTKRVNMQVPGGPRLVFTMELVAHGPDRTDLVYRAARPRAAKDRGRRGNDAGASSGGPADGGRIAYRARRGRRRGTCRRPGSRAGHPGGHRPPPY